MCSVWGARPLLSSVVCLCAQPRKGWLLGLGSWTLCTQQGGASQLVGMGQSQDKGLVVPSEKTQTWVSLRLELPVRLLGSHKGNFVWLRREEAPRPSANGLAASEPQLTAEIAPETLSLADRANGRPDGHVWDKSVLCASGQHCLIQTRHVVSWKTEWEGAAGMAPHAARREPPLPTADRVPGKGGWCRGRDWLCPALWVLASPTCRGHLGCAGVSSGHSEE